MSIEVNALKTNCLDIKAARITDLSLDLQTIDQFAVDQDVEMLSV